MFNLIIIGDFRGVVGGVKMGENAINKIIYFDKETIQNILQEQNHGNVLNTTDVSTSIRNEGNI